MVSTYVYVRRLVLKKATVSMMPPLVSSKYSSGRISAVTDKIP